MIDEADLNLARECVEKAFWTRHGPGWATENIRHGCHDGDAEVQSALRAIKAERARTVAFLKRYCDGASEFHQDTGSGYCCLKTAANILGAIQHGEHGE